MLNVSKEIKDYLAGTGRTFKAFLTLEGKTEDEDKIFSEEIMSLSLNSGVCSEKLSIGNVNSASLEAVLYGVDKAVQFSGKKVNLKIQAGVVEESEKSEETDGTEEPKESEEVKEVEEVEEPEETAVGKEKFNLGSFTAQKPTREDQILSFKAFDCLASSGSVTYFPLKSLTESEEIDIVFADICRQIGKADEYEPIYSSDFEGEKARINPKKLSGMTVRNALGQIAGFLGGNVICNSENKIEVKHFETCGFATDENMISTSEIAERVFTLGGMNCTCGEKTYTVGSQSGNILSFSNVLMTEEQLQAVFDELKKVSYRAMSLENLVGTFVVEPGDIITATVGGESLAVPVMQQSIDFDGGLMNSFESFCESEIEDGSSNLSDISQQVEKLESDIEETNEKIDTTEGKADEANEFAEMFSNALGLYKIVETLSDGSTKIYYADKPQLSKADYIIGLNAGGFAYAVTNEETNTKAWNDGNPEWNGGMDKDGNAIMKTIRANKITADELDIKNLTSLGASLGGWEFDENRIFKATDNGTIEISLFPKKDPNETDNPFLNWINQIMSLFSNSGSFIKFDRKTADGFKNTFFITYGGWGRFRRLSIDEDDSIDFYNKKCKVGNVNIGNQFRAEVGNTYNIDLEDHSTGILMVGQSADLNNCAFVAFSSSRVGCVFLNSNIGKNLTVVTGKYQKEDNTTGPRISITNNTPGYHEVYFHFFRGNILKIFKNGEEIEWK